MYRRVRTVCNMRYAAYSASFIYRCWSCRKSHANNTQVECHEIVPFLRDANHFLSILGKFQRFPRSRPFEQTFRATLTCRNRGMHVGLFHRFSSDVSANFLVNKRNSLDTFSGSQAQINAQIARIEGLK